MDGRLGQFGQERIALSRPVLDERRVSEADVHRRGAGHPVQRAIERGHAVLPRLVRLRLHVRLVELDDVSARLEQVLHLRVDRGGIVERHVGLARIEFVLRLLGHRERPGNRDLDRARGVRPQEANVARFDGMPSADAAHDARHDDRLPAAADHRAGMVEVEPVERRREAVRVALSPDLSVGHDVDAGALLIADRQHGRIVLCLLEQLGRNTPQRLQADPRRHGRRQPITVDQPVGLRIGSDERRGQQHAQRRHCWPTVTCISTPS